IPKVLGCAHLHEVSAAAPLIEAEPPSDIPRRERVGVAVLAIAAGVMLPIAGWRGTHDVWPIPLDDAYIYAQYARGLAQGALFEWSPGEGYTRGATSPLYPLLLAPAWLLGLRDHWLMLWATLLNIAGFAVAALAVHDVLVQRGGRAIAA